MVAVSDIGRELTPTHAKVEAGRLRFFRRTISGQTAQRPQGAETPPTYLFALDLLDAPNPRTFVEELDIDIGAVLHGEQSFIYHAPIKQGDELTFRTTVSDVFTKKGGELTFVVQDTKVTNAASLHVADMRRTLIVLKR